MILLNQQPIKVGEYPNKEIFLGEELALLVSDSKESIQNITLRFEDNSDLITLKFVSSWLKEEGYEKQKLILPYMPYSRMDRKVSRHLFSLDYVADFVNEMKFSEVVVLEPHSTVTLDKLNNSVSVSYTNKLIEHAMNDMNFDKEKDVIIFPDAGARKRYAGLIPSEYRLIEAEKERNFNTGDILNMTLKVEDSRPIRNALIVDDLCSRGRTFIEISDACESIKVEKCFLAVTHLEANVYTGELLNKVNTVYTTDALEPFLKKASEYKQIQVLPLPQNFKMTSEVAK